MGSSVLIGPCVIAPLEGPSWVPSPHPEHPHQGALVQASRVAEYLFGPRSGVGIRLGTGVGDPAQERGIGSQGDGRLGSLIVRAEGGTLRWGEARLPPFPQGPLELLGMCCIGGVGKLS